MRILIYLLAMLTGFSAAEAARPVAIAPSALGSAVAEAAAEVAAVSLDIRQDTGYLPEDMRSLAAVADVPEQSRTADSLRANSPVTRFDVSRQ